MVDVPGDWKALFTKPFDTREAAERSAWIVGGTWLGVRRLTRIEEAADGSFFLLYRDVPPPERKVVVIDSRLNG